MYVDAGQRRKRDTLLDIVFAAAPIELLQLLRISYVSLILIQGGG